MEKPLERHMNEVMSASNVVAAVCTDQQGLVLDARGVDPSSSGVISSVAKQAANLMPDNHHTPVVCIEAEHGNIMIKNHDEITMAVYKKSD